MIQRIHHTAVFLLLALLLHSSVNAQLPDYHVQLFDENDGLRTDMDRVIKDKNGFIWILYYDRVQRFDGKHTVEFFIGGGLGSLYSDRNNRIWLASSSRVYQYENDHKGFSEIAIPHSGKLSFNSFYQLDGRDVWIFTNQGFFAYDPVKLSFFPVTGEKCRIEIPVNTRRYTNSLSGHTFYYSSKDTIWSQDLMTGRKLFLPGQSTFSLNALSDDQAIMSTWKNQTFLYDFQKQTISVISPSKFLKNCKDDFLIVRAVLHLDHHRYLLATTKGLLEYNGSPGQLSLKQLFFKGQLVSNVGNIVDLFMDSDRKVWACSEYSLMKFDPSEIVIGLIRNSVTDPSKNFANQVRNFAPDEKENLWIATNNGIVYWDLEKNSFQSFYAVADATDKMNHPSVRGIAYDGTNVIIGQTNRGVWLYNPIRKVYRRPVYETGKVGEATRIKLEEDFIDQIYPLYNGQYIIAARDGGYILEPGTYRIRQFDFPGKNENLNFCYQDQSRQVWIGTAKGIYCLDSNMVYQFDIREGLGPGVTRCMYQWNDQEYIVGARGLFLLQIVDGKVKTSILHPYFNQIEIRTIFRDHRDRMWLSTDEGLYLLDYTNGQVESFDQFDNVQGDNYNQNCFYLNQNGMLFLGGSNGINYFQPDKIKFRKDSLQVTLMKVTVNEDDTSYYNRASLLSLRSNQRSVEIDFMAPYYGNPNRLQYKYQLKGLHDEWKSVGNTNTVRFTSLSPGNYKFKIAASINGMDWYESKETLPFIIAFPFWQTWWFIVLSIIAMATCILFLVKRRIRIIRKQEAVRREGEVQLITMNRDLSASQLTALRAQMNPHFIFNALNSVQRYILKGDVDQANKYLSKFSRLQREVLKNSSQDFITLDKEIEILELYLQLEQMRFDEKFEYTIHIDKDIDTSEIKIPPMVVQPFIENAIWHGLMPRLGPKKVDVEFLLHSDELYCRIVDNGIGRAASARMKKLQDATTLNESKGLTLVHERLKILEQLYQHAYQVEIIDKIDPAGVVEGTEVNLTLYVGP